MRKLFVATAAVIVLVLLVVPSIAAPGGNGKGKGQGGGTAAEVVQSDITLNQSAPRFGEAITFTTTHPPLSDGALIWLHCSQGGEMVHQVSSGEGSTFVLAGGHWTGGAASCTAMLYYYEYQGHTQVGMVTLDETSFEVGE